MAQYIKPLDEQDGEQRYEVVMLAAGKDGSVVEATNPLPVTLGAESVSITGPVTIPGSVEINNDVGNPIPVSRNTTVNSATNPLYISGQVETRYANAAATTAFGESYGLTITPVIQLDAVYGLDSDRWNTYLSASGAVTNPNSIFLLESGTTQYGYATIQSKRTLRYRPGQGALSRFTAAFENAASGYTQRAGLGSLTDAIQVGYNGTSFGVLRASGGQVELRNLEITNPASGAETVTITLNNVVYTVSVTAGTAEQNAAIIGDITFTGWNASAHDTHVRFQRQSLGAASGTYSISSTGTLTGTFTQLNAGVAQTENWTYQADFNLDTLDGNGPSGMVIDPSKLNVYQINFRWLGAGEIRFAIEDEATGNMIAFHHIHYTNKNTTPHLLNPSMKVQYVAASLGGTGTNVKTYGSSVMAAIEGDITVTYLPNATSHIMSGISSATHQHMLSIRNNNIYNNKINQREILLKGLSAAATSASSSPIIVTLYKTISTAAPRTWSNLGAGSFTAYSTTNTTITPSIDRVIYQTVIIPGAANMLDLSPLRMALAPGETVAVGIYGTSNIQNAAASLIWIED